MKKLIGLFIFFLFLLGCKDKMNDPVGLDEINKDIPKPVYIGGIFTDSVSNYHHESNTGSSDKLWIGESHSIESRILIRFEVDDSIALANADSAKVVLVIYGGKPAKSIEFKVYPLTKSWDETVVGWEKSSSNSQWDNPGGDYDTTVIADIVINEAEMEFTFDCDEFSLLDTSFEGNKGMIFVYELGDTLISICSKESTQPLTLTLFYGDSTKDSIDVSEDVFITNSTYIEADNEIVLGEGYAMRALLLFNIDTIPENVTINRATLAFKIKSDKSYFDTTTVYIHEVTGEWDEDETEFYSSSLAYFTVQKDDTISEISLTSLIQDWVNGGENYGILLRLKNESGFCSRLVLDAMDSPVLSIYYTPLPESGD